MSQEVANSEALLDPEEAAKLLLDLSYLTSSSGSDLLQNLQNNGYHSLPSDSNIAACPLIDPSCNDILFISSVIDRESNNVSEQGGVSAAANTQPYDEVPIQAPAGDPETAMRTASIVSRRKQSLFAFKNSKKREEGASYSSFHKEGDSYVLVEKPERKMKDRCPESASCMKPGSKAFNCAELSEGARKAIFDAFWKLDWKAKHVYVKTLCERSEPKKVASSQKNRKLSVRYHLPIEDGGAKVRVCRRMFANTLGINEDTISEWVRERHRYQTEEEVEASDDAVDGSVAPPPKRIRRVEETESRVKQLKDLLLGMPRVPSHYCRSQDKKIYLERHWTSERDLYNWYTKRVAKPLSRPKFASILKEENIGLFQWHKDLCSFCTEMSLKKKGKVITDAEETKWEQHKSEQKKALAEKEQMKKTVNQNDTLLIAVDVEQALPLPKLFVDASFFRLKMLVHNYTIYELSTKQVHCYVFTEQEATSQADVFATFLEDYISSQVLERPSIKKVVIFSDNCSSQNKNAILSNVLLHLAITLNLTIEQKFLIVGHTHLDVDTYHSTVEKKIRREEVHLVEEYVEFFKTAFGNGEKVTVHRMDQSRYNKYEACYVKSIRPGARSGDPKVNDVRAYQYTPQGELKYSLEVGGNLMNLPGSLNIKAAFNPTKLYNEPIKLTPSKLKHMTELMSFIPHDKIETFKKYLS